MDQDTLTLLEFPQVTRILQRFAHTSLGGEALNELTPLKERREIEERLSLVAEARRWIEEKGRFSLRHVADPAAILEKLQNPGEVLEPPEFLSVLTLLEALGRMQESADPALYPGLSSKLSLLPSHNLVQEIDRVVGGDGEVRESAHPELASVRRKRARSRLKIEQHFHRYLSGAQAKFLIQDPYITERNGRFVVPVRAEQQGRIPGIAHALSSSGSTVFLEPFDAVDLNNDILIHQERERELLLKVLRDLTERLRSQMSLIETARILTGELDALFCLGQFAERFSCVTPELSSGLDLMLEQARHPLLVDTLEPDQVVPISVRLGKENNVLVVSGPNAGGKTVVLKTIGLLSLMAQSGLPVPAREAKIPIVGQVLADIGDHQSITRHLSTFSGHVLRIREMIETLNAPGLVLLDEVGTGTDPEHGAALAVAVIEHFRDRGSLVVATTHARNVKMFATVTAGVGNASVGFDLETHRPTYELIMGSSGESSGLDMAQQLGLPLSLIEEARRQLGKKQLQVEEYLQQLRSELKHLQQAQSDLEKEKLALGQLESRLQADFARRRAHLEDQVQEVVQQWGDDFKRETGRFLKSLKDRMQASRLKSEIKAREAVLKEAFRRRVKEDLQERMQPDRQSSSASEMAEGDRVFHSFFRKEGTVVSVQDDSVVVEIEGKRITASLPEIRRLERSLEKGRKVPSNVSLHVVEDAQRELNLVGCTVEEALPKVDKFLDRAFVSQLSEVRIIHGFGTGRLKAALGDFLRGHPHVRRCEVKGGATEVTLES